METPKEAGEGQPPTKLPSPFLRMEVGPTVIVRNIRATGDYGPSSVRGAAFVFSRCRRMS
jgi:hypothetical protein